MPIPASDLTIIFEICHLSPASAKLPRRSIGGPTPAGRRRPPPPRRAHELRIALPEFRSTTTARDVEALILDLRPAASSGSRNTPRAAAHERKRRTTMKKLINASTTC